MTVKNLLVLFLSVICISACSKKEGDNKQSESSSPIMAIVDEASPEALQAPLRDPLQNIVVNTDNNINADAAQNLAGDIPPSYAPKANSPQEETVLQNNMQKPFDTGNNSITGIERDRNVTVTRTASGYSATAVIRAPTLKPQPESGVMINRSGGQKDTP